MFPNDLYISDPTDGILYVVENDTVKSSMSIIKEARAILVCQNMSDIYTVNRDENTVTRIHNGEPMGEIPVGKTPYGICEDINGRIYVTNYADNTVSVIEDGAVVGLPIPVSAGPRGIIADYYGNVWVACYLTNTVVKIVNRTVVDEIAVAYNPEGITCSPTNDIWVACSGSNVAVKITNGVKKLTINTGRCPVAIVTDRKGNIFTANFEDDTVTMIATAHENQTTEIPVGDGPSAIAVNTDGMIYVTSNLSGEKVFKVNPSTAAVIDRIRVCKSQCAFGDFTGCAAYNVFYPSGRSGGSGSIGSEDLENVVQTLYPTFKVVSMEENDQETTIKVGSDLLNLSKFAKLVLNDVEANEDGEFVLNAQNIGNTLELIGYFEEGGDPITFKEIKFNSSFTAYFALVDENYENYFAIKSKLIDFSNKDVVTTFLQQNTAGHIVVWVPSRVTDILADGLMVQGNYNIGNDWKQNIESEVTGVLNFEFTVGVSGNNYPITYNAGSNGTLIVKSGTNTLVEGTDYNLTEGTEANDYTVELISTANIIDSKVQITSTGVTPANSPINKIKVGSAFSEAKLNSYDLLVNTYVTSANEKWMFNFFNVLD